MFQGTGYTLTGKAGIHFQGQTLAGESIDDSQDADPAAGGQPIASKVDCPLLIGAYLAPSAPPRGTAGKSAAHSRDIRACPAARANGDIRSVVFAAPASPTLLAEARVIRSGLI